MQIFKLILKYIARSLLNIKIKRRYMTEYQTYIII